MQKIRFSSSLNKMKILYSGRARAAPYGVNFIEKNQPGLNYTGSGL
jgi:hypothetical protein